MTTEDDQVSLGSDCPGCPADPCCPLYTTCLWELCDIYGNCGTRPCPVRPVCRNRQETTE